MQKRIRLKKKPKTKLIGKTIHYFSEVSSTNEIAKKIAAIGAREGTVIIAETQTRGKGRLGREWVSPRGGLWLSTILRPKLDAMDTPKLTLTTSLAVAKTINQLHNLKAEVKWPNDVLVNAKKVCGILTEANTRGSVTNFVVIGIGVNANIELNSLPKQLRENATTLKHELQKDINREEFLRVLLEKLEYYCKMLARGRFDIILKEWKNISRLLGVYVQVTSLDGRIEGWATDVDDNGALIIRIQNGTTRRILSGDINLVS